MASDYSDKSVLIVDHGSFCGLADRLAKDWGRVMYWSPWKRNCPQSTQLMVGNGLDNVERVVNLFDAVREKPDLVAFTDCYDGDFQEYLEEQGFRVWGSRKADRFEWDRKLFKETNKELGLPVSPYRMVQGVTELRKYLSENPGQAVKLTMFRGDRETFVCDDYRLVKGIIDMMEVKYGPVAERIKFMVEKKIEDAQEAGYDGICIDDQFTDGFVDYEIKNKCTLVAIKPYDQIAEPVRMINEKWAPILKQERYRGPIGTEIRIDKKGVPYFGDLTARNASPPGESMWRAMTNLSDVMYHGSVGELVKPEWAGKFVCQIMLYLNWQDQQWQAVKIPDENRDGIALSSYAKVDGLYYPIAAEGYEQLPWCDETMGAAIGVGDTLEEAIEEAKENAASVEGLGVHYDLASIADAIKEIEKGEENGIPFADELPEPETVLEEV